MNTYLCHSWSASAPIFSRGFVSKFIAESIIASLLIKKWYSWYPYIILCIYTSGHSVDIGADNVFSLWAKSTTRINVNRLRLDLLICIAKTFIFITHFFEVIHTHTFLVDYYGFAIYGSLFQNMLWLCNENCVMSPSSSVWAHSCT